MTKLLEPSDGRGKGRKRAAGRPSAIRSRGLRHALLTATGLGALLASGVPAAAGSPAATPALSQLAQAPRQHAFDIPAQPLAAALRAFSEQSGMQVAYNTPDLAGLNGNRVSGELRAEDALRALLSGTGVLWRFTDAGTVALERVGAEGAMTLEPLTVEAQRAGETGKGPVDGYVATRSTAGTKTDTPLIETPQAISVVGAEQIDRQKARTVGEALRYTPGLLSAQGFNRTDDAFYMRGFQVNHESLYADGLRSQPNIYSNSAEPYGLERIEVLKGPASVLYGQAGPGGVINMVTKRPTTDPLHEIQVQGGSFERKQVATDHAGALDAEGRFSYRLTALARDSETMVDHIDDDKVYVAPSLTWRPTESTSLTLLTSYAASKTAYYYGFPADGTVLSNPNGDIARNRFIGEPAYNKWDRTAATAGYELEHRFNDALQVRQNVRYSDYENDYADIYFGAWQADRRTVSRGAYERVDESDMLSVDNQLQADFATGRVSHTLLAGADYTRGVFERVQYTGTVAALDLYDPAYGSTVTRAATPALDRRESYDQIGVYLQEQAKLDDRWVLVLGGRQDWVEDQAENRLTGERTTTGQDAFTGRVGLVYLTGFGLAPYASYAESFQPQTGARAGGSAFEPTTGQQYEIGVKYQPEGRDSSVTLATYELTRQNVLTLDPDNPGFNTQTGEIRSRGVEVEARLTLADGLRIIGGYTYVDAEVTKSNGTDLGNRPTNTPEHMASLWAEYEVQETGLRGLVFGGGVRYVGDTVNLTDTYTVPSYTVFDAMVGYETDGWRFTLNAVNLTDETYVAACTYGCFYGDARTVLGTVSYRW